MFWGKGLPAGTESNTKTELSWYKAVLLGEDKASVKGGPRSTDREYVTFTKRFGDKASGGFFIFFYLNGNFEKTSETHCACFLRLQVASPMNIRESDQSLPCHCFLMDQQRRRQWKVKFQMDFGPYFKAKSTSKANVSYWWLVTIW